MDYKHTIDILSENIKELSVIVDGFAKNNRIPALDLDLVLAKTRNLYDVLLMLKKYAVDDTEIRQEVQVNKDNPDSKEDSNRENPENESENETLALDSNIEKNSQETPKSEKSIIENESASPKTVSDRFKKQSVSLNDSLVQTKSYYDISSKLQSKPLSDIVSAIGINDKFLFINELFKGDTGKYNETIQVINNASDFNEAFNYLSEKFQWDMDGELVQKILDLIRRKFITGKNE